MTPKEVLALCRERDVKAVELRFTDLLGKPHRVTIPVQGLDESMFEDGYGFDASKLPGWQTVPESDMLLLPQPDTATIRPLTSLPTLCLFCTVQDPLSGDDYARDPRHIAIKSTNYLRRTGIADEALVGVKCGFHIFEPSNAPPHPLPRHLSDPTDGPESLSASIAPAIGGPAPADLLGEMMRQLQRSGVRVDGYHWDHGHPARGQFSLHQGDLVRTADALLICKDVVREVAAGYGKSATFMPKPVLSDQGCGMPTRFSLWKEERPLLPGNEYAGLSETALYAMGGLLRHTATLMALTNPTTNSYRRLVPGSASRPRLGYSWRDRSAACRIPAYSSNPSTKRIEYRVPDPSCNPYLAFAALLMAIIDGVQNKLGPGEPLPADVAEPRAAAQVPASLGRALAALEADHEFLLRDDVFTADVLEMWIRLKREGELRGLRERPHPYEFELYYDL